MGKTPITERGGRFADNCLGHWVDDQNKYVPILDRTSHV